MMRGRAWVLGAVALGGCTVGPKYRTPSAPVPESFKEATPAEYRAAGTWLLAKPADGAPRGEWWRMFGDATLDRLEKQLTVSNQNLKSQEARFREARAMIRYQRADLFPTISAAPTLNSIKYSANQPYFQTLHPPPEGDLELPFDLSYELDVWGRVRHEVAAARAEAQASAGDLASTSLSLHAELALDYIDLRSADAQQRLLDDTVKAYADALRLTKNRLAGGYAPGSDVAQAQTQLDDARVQDTDIGVSRAQYEHAIAVLTGQPPASFSLAPAPLDLVPPDVPPGLPSELLQRRPDIAAAERRVAEANERIGIAIAAYYPSVTFSASSGFQGSSFANWFVWPSLFWAVGTTITQQLFDGGRLQAQTDQMRAAYDDYVAQYRQSTLTAFQQVEDNLAALRILGREAVQQQEAVNAAGYSLKLFNNRYVGGEDTYLQVITAQTIALQNQRNDVDIRRRRMEASITLVKALGGGWDRADMASLKEHGLPAGAFVPLAQ